MWRFHRTYVLFNIVKLIATNLGFISTNDYVIVLTVDVWVMIVLGGLGNNRGTLLGASIVTILDRVTAIAAIQLNAAGADLEFNYGSVHPFWCDSPANIALPAARSPTGTNFYNQSPSRIDMLS